MTRVLKRTRLGRLRLRRQPVTYTTLPGGVRLSFHGYLPAKPCLKCHVGWPAAAYAKRVYTNDRRRLLDFDDWCLQCDPPDDFPRDLNGVRPTSTYTDASGRHVGWRERDRVRGLFGPELPLELMGLRKTADGVYRPQPKLDRRPIALQEAHPHAPQSFRPIRDRRRCYAKAVIRAAVVAQAGQCPLCPLPFTESNPAVGGHRVSYADGGATVPANCVALHEKCNREMGRRSLQEVQRERRRLF